MKHYTSRVPTMVWMTPLLGFVVSLLVPPHSAHAQAVQQAHSSAELLSEHDAAVPGTSAMLGLHLRLDPEWHAYWKNPGDSGMATSLAWTLPSGMLAGPMQWPAPHRIDVGPITSYGYSHEVLLMVEVPVPRSFEGEQLVLQAQADWLVCKDICIPASARIGLSLPVSATRKRDPATALLFDTSRAQMPRPLTAWRTRVTRHGQDLTITLTSTAGASPRLQELAFIPDREGDIDDSFHQVSKHTAGGYQLLLKADPASQPGQRLTGIMTARPGFQSDAGALAVDMPVEAGAPPPAVQSPTGLAIALVLAFTGGMLLNLMPCVFPVLAIKVLGVLERAHGRAGALREHGLLFTLGVLISFIAMAGLMLWLRNQGLALGWGFQLQSPVVVSGLALLFLTLALNLSGVFNFGAGAQALAGRVRVSNARLDAVASGLLATLVATPCTAPFMGAALGFAITRPATDALMVFAAIALGMALPYAMLCLFPAALRRLPRPGRWMETLKQFLAFPLYGTVVWLLWVLGQQSGVDAVARLMLAMVTLACALWCWGRLTAPGGLRVLALAFFLGLTTWIAWPRAGADASETAWAPWSASAVQAALTQGQPVFVDFTAAWCVSCQVNKRMVLHTDGVSRAFEEAGVRRMRADWTHRDPAITLALEQLGRSGVPVYALYTPAGGEPILLPEILTRGIVLKALADISQRATQHDSADPATRRTP